MGIEHSASRVKRDRKRREAQERRWASMASPVVVRHADPSRSDGDESGGAGSAVAPEAPGAPARPPLRTVSREELQNLRKVKGR